MSLSLEHAQLMSIGDLASATAADLQQVQAEASELLRKSKALKDWIDGNYQYEKPFATWFQLIFLID